MATVDVKGLKANVYTTTITNNV